jgi:hypothetical protein
MKFKSVLFALLFLPAVAFPQNEYISAGHTVYRLLKELSVKGAVDNYNDAVIPLPKREIISLLTDADKESLTTPEKEILKKYLERFNPGSETVSILNDGLNGLISGLEKKLYLYQDSLAFLSVMPAIDLSAVYSEKSERTAYLLNLGGKIAGSYSSWLGFSVFASNGIVKGDRIAALEDGRVAGSFTFNNTRINYFDETYGHLALHSGILDLQFGRERILWGSGHNTKMVLSDNPSAFDMLRLKLAYKTLSYEFVHGWLQQGPYIIYSDPTAEPVRSKDPKYIALNRLGYMPSDIFNIGITQAIIYSNRPFEAAYLNPFLLWESAQRSLNDLDNSFLVLDSEVKPLNGLSISGTYLFDDINFNWLDNWNNISNRSAWQLSAMLTSPLFIDNFSLKIDYSQVRPYTFSHVGKGEALTYTSGGSMLGYPHNPNSGLTDIRLNYRASGNMNFGLSYSYLLHGSNQVSEDVYVNVGGDVFEYFTNRNYDKPELFDGRLEKTHVIGFNCEYEFLRNYYISFEARSGIYKTIQLDESLNTVILSLKLLTE